MASGDSVPTSQRVIDIEDGIAMVVTDLHGDWALYARYRDHFLDLQARGLAHTLIFTGDLIHSEGPPQADRSLDIVLDLLALREELGERLIVLLGNHEMPHIHHVILAKGQHVYTPRFEAAMGEHRDAILGFFAELPFYARTRAGVTLCHAGAFAEAHDPDAMAQILGFSHRCVLAEAAAKVPPAQRPSLRAGLGKLIGVPYADLAWEHFAAGPGDPRYDDFLIGFFAGEHPDFALLWSALFTNNEREFGEERYAGHVDALLGYLGEGFHRQRVLVTGHLACRDGYRLVARGRQLRLASGSHARPHTSARYLLFDAGEPVTRAEALLDGLGMLQ